MSMIKVAFCRMAPTVSKIDESLYMVAYCEDTGYTELVAETIWKNCERSKENASQFAAKCFELEWKLPDVDESQIIEFLGIPTRYARSRFNIMKVIILAKGTPVSYETISKAGWGAVIDKDVLEDGIRNLNNFLSKHRIPRFIHCDKGFVYMDSNFPSRNPNACRNEHPKPVC